jgi:hypothetical protein
MMEEESKRGATEASGVVTNGRTSSTDSCEEGTDAAITKLIIKNLDKK